MRLVLIVLLAFCFDLHAQNNTESQSQQIDLPAVKVDTAFDPRIKQSYQLIDDIKALNPPDRLKLELRQGVMQVFANSTDTIQLNQYKTLPYIGLESVINFNDNWGLETRGYFAQNILFTPEPGSVNGTQAYMRTIEAGLRYRFILDQTQIDDYVAIKTLYHTSENNFKLTDNDIFIKSYSGVILGFERSIPVTPKIGVLASLDINLIQDAKLSEAGAAATSEDETKSRELEKSGIGFQMRGGLYYKLNWFGSNLRFGGAYWQGGYVNRLSPAAQLDRSRTSHVQAYRAVSGSFLFEF